MKAFHLIYAFALLTIALNSGCNTEKRLHKLSFSKEKHHNKGNYENETVIRRNNIADEYELSEAKTITAEIPKTNKKVSVEQSKISKSKANISKKLSENKIYKKIILSEELKSDESGKEEHWSNILAIVFAIGAIISTIVLLIYASANAFLLIGLFSLFAIIFGSIARRKIKRNPENYTGLKRANFSLITGIALFIVWIILLIALLIFFLFFFTL